MKTGNLNRNILIIAGILVCVLIVMKYMQGRKLRENYETSKESLLDYVEKEKLVPIEVMTRAEQVTDDEDFIQNAYFLAKAGKRSELVGLIKTL
jgi:hypothetical protein